MTITLWILSGYFITTTLLYIISLIKNIPLMRKISSGFMIPTIETAAIILLLRFLPDSFHIMIITAITLCLASISEILFLFTDIKVLSVLSRIIFFISQIFLLDIYKSTFFINRIPTWLCILSAVFYLLILTGVLLFAGKQKILKHCLFIIEMIISFFINYCTFITLCFERNLHSALQFSGTLTVCALVIYYILNNTRFNFKYKNSILLSLLIISQGFISAGNILMIK